jgi:hypothetical protein
MEERGGVRDREIAARKILEETARSLEAVLSKIFKTNK